MSAVIFSRAARLLNHRDDGVHFGPVGFAGGLEVVDLGRNLCLTADPNQLGDRLDETIAFARMWEMLCPDTAPRP